MKCGEIYTTTVEKMTNLGLGLARINNVVVFIKDACPQDVLRIKISRVTKNYSYATIEEIIEPSIHRISPFCPMQKICGACQLQYIDYKYQLEIKQQIVKDTIKNIAGIEDIEIPLPVASPQIKNFRHKIQYPISQTKNSKRILAGYYKQSSHEIVNIKYCPIQPQICDDIIGYIRENAHSCGISGYIEHSHQGILRHVVIRNSTYNNKNLVVLVINSKNKTPNIEQFAKFIYENFEEVSGVCINYNTQKTNAILGNKTECITGSEYIEEKLLDKLFLIGAETFFQVNPKSAENIFQYVKNYIEKNYQKPTILDAYAGISAFGICLSDICAKVVTIEENNKSVELAKKSIEINNINNIEIHSGDAGEFFSKEKRKFDAIILDPPRKGCSEQSLDYAMKLTKNSIIYVSCNPATLARDLKYLKEHGCNIQSIKPFDMFCHSYHIENVAIINIT